MHWLDYSTDNCSIQRTLDVVGDKWSMIVLRELFNGVCRFDQIRWHTGISEPVLSNRLRRLVDAEVLETVPYRESGRRTRQEYRLTTKGRGLYPVLIALMQWGDQYRIDPEGPAVTVQHRECGNPVEAIVRCTGGHDLQHPRDAQAVPGPAARALQR
ncbi:MULTISPECIES: winged helix-turn-helix transcriptional regulator [Rhodococcus]|uniref:Transcriptional regulator n=2 Tax=Rhodococcus TaxID=1827 RepID=A0A076F3P2_RHOOP|nr:MULTISPECIES: helix-turn-helix domain-containing protein [Rhodococcus]AII10404.1 transcriptional regulator [Rhodococcus opacus]WAM19113.1 helix-turn-helix domain-containing protein [Rhodococcus sp. JS3073]GAF47145.1 putative HxlR family transcriptional regulator [Rhodococcus wratislaviensis NBRC 100605]